MSEDRNILIYTYKIDGKMKIEAEVRGRTTRSQSSLEKQKATLCTS